MRQREVQEIWSSLVDAAFACPCVEDLCAHCECRFLLAAAWLEWAALLPYWHRLAAQEDTP